MKHCLLLVAVLAFIAQVGQGQNTQPSSAQSKFIVGDPARASARTPFNLPQKTKSYREAADFLNRTLTKAGYNELAWYVYETATHQLSGFAVFTKLEQPLLTILIQGLTGFWQGKDQEAWGWVLPALLPTLTLIVGSILVADNKAESEKREVSQLTYRIAFWISTFYLFVVLLTLGSVAGKAQPLESLHRSSWLLGAVQGLVGTSLGVFFSSARIQKRKAV